MSPASTLGSLAFRNLQDQRIHPRWQAQTLAMIDPKITHLLTQTDLQHGLKKQGFLPCQRYFGSPTGTDFKADELFNVRACTRSQLVKCSKDLKDAEALETHQSCRNARE